MQVTHGLPPKLASFPIANETFAEEGDHARVELAVKFSLSKPAQFFTYADAATRADV